MATKQARALANHDQPRGVLLSELTAYVQAFVDTNARLVISAAPILNEPPDTSRRPHRTWFMAAYDTGRPVS